MKRPRILLDVDGPLTAGFFDKACETLRDLGVNAHPDAIDRWDICEAFKVPEKTAIKLYEVLRLQYVADAFAPREGSVEFVAALQEWADVYYVTSPLDGSPTWAFDRERWLKEWFGASPSRIVSTRDKSLIRGAALVDDRQSNVAAWTKVNRKGLGILWREPHNAADEWGVTAGSYRELGLWLDTLRGKQ